MNSLFNSTGLIVIPDWNESDLKGKNGKKVLVVTQMDEVSDDLVQFLTKILEAVKLNFSADVHFYNITHGQSISFFELNKSHQYRKIISFGANPSDLCLKIQVNLYENIELQDKSFLFVDDLNVIFQERKAGKKAKAAQLWQALKNLFKTS
ncbi:MAG: hypothetical protein AAFO07_22960 [Bacteroidota bacterium]